MSKFAYKSILSVKGRQRFKQLIILEDNVNVEKLQIQINTREIDGTESGINGVLDDYENSLEEKYASSFRGIIAIMNRVANLQSVPKEKFRDITPQGESVSEYEFKFQDLRVYAIKIFNGQMVLVGGYKNNQDSNITDFRALKKKYLADLKSKK